MDLQVPCVRTVGVMTYKAYERLVSDDAVGYSALQRH